MPMISYPLKQNLKMWAVAPAGLTEAIVLTGSYMTSMTHGYGQFAVSP